MLLRTPNVLCKDAVGRKDVAKDFENSTAGEHIDAMHSLGLNDHILRLKTQRTHDERQNENLSSDHS
jgi:hypothetical protein